MMNVKQTFVTLMMVGMACAVLMGCDRRKDRPQFVVISKTSESGNMRIHPLFAFDINADGTCEVTYVDVSGSVLCRVTGTDLPVGVFERYRKRLEKRRCSGESTICISENGKTDMTEVELSDIATIVRKAPPNSSVMKNLHPAFLSAFKTSLE